QGALVKRVASKLRSTVAQPPGPLYPVEIEIDNDASELFTVLRIRTEDTTGFLYELTNALALSGVYISRVSVHSKGSQVFDTLLVADAKGHTMYDEHNESEYT